MYKKIIIIFIAIFLTGCTSNKINQNDDIERIYLNNEYYNKGNFIDIVNLDSLNDKTYILYIYNDYCYFQIPCEDIFKEFMKRYNIDFYKMTFENFKNTKYYGTILYAPSVIIIKNNNIIAYLDADKDEDLDKYQDVDAFQNWMNNFIYFKKNE